MNSSLASIRWGQVIFALVIILSFFYMTRHLLVPVVMGAVTAVIFWPLHLKVRVWLRQSSMVASTIITLLVTFGIFVPAGVLIILGAKAGLDQLEGLQTLWSGRAVGKKLGFFEMIYSYNTVRQLFDYASTMLPFSLEELIAGAQDVVLGLGYRIGDALTVLVRNLPALIFSLVIVVVSNFFFLLDGERLVDYFRHNRVFEPEQTERLIRKFGMMCRSVILATVVSATAQMLIFGTACISLGSSNVALIMFMVFLTSFIPLVGSVPVTFSVAIYHAIMISGWGGLVLFLMGLFVTMMDNLIRPWVLQGAGNLHPLLAFIAAFGGLQVMGIFGIFLGPILAGMFVVTMQIVTISRNPQTS